MVNIEAKISKCREKINKINPSDIFEGLEINNIFIDTTFLIVDEIIHITHNQ